jgi:hypothetical protein
MSEKMAFRLAVIAAVAMLAIAAFMGVTAQPCQPLPMSTLTAFELVRSVADLQRIFGMPGDACRADVVSQLDHANTIDMFAYIPAYTAFYALTAHALGRRDRTLGWIAVVLAIGCAVADVFENLAMFHFSAAPDRDSPWMTGLIVSTNAKWVGLAVVTTLCGVMLARRGGFGWLALPLCLAPMLASLWAVAAPDAAGQYLIPGMVVASVLLLAVAVWGSFAKAPVAAGASQS